MRLVTIIGNRPQFIKAAAVSRELRARHEEILVHTGQHYDDELSTVFVSELGVPAPERELDLGRGSNTQQTGRMLSALDGVLTEEDPQAVMVYGDTNSTLAGALAGAQRRLPVIHVEAGMRSLDRSMPEELNRVVCDHVSDLLLCSSGTAVDNLRREGIVAGVVEVGDVMVDVHHAFAPRAREQHDVLERIGVAPGEYVLATAHRAGNVDDPDRLSALVELLLSVEQPVVAPLHPRTAARLERAGLTARLREGGVRLLAPLGYLGFTTLLLHARAVLTDSGGVQKEAYLAGVPCVTLRSTTEWTETVTAGWNTLVDLDAGAARRALEAEPPAQRPQLYGDGRAATRVVGALDGLPA